MPIFAGNQMTFHRALYGKILEDIKLLKRDDDQAEGTVRALYLFDCRRSMIYKGGEPLQGDMASEDNVVWHLPRIELDRVGVQYINALDRIVDRAGRTWQPESTTQIIVKLCAVHVCVACRRTDPA